MGAHNYMPTGLAQEQPALWDSIPPEKQADTVPNPVKAEKARLHAANLRVLAFLQGRGARGATNWELSQPPFGISGTRRVRELRAWGYEIERVHVDGGTWNYIYKGVRPI